MIVVEMVGCGVNEDRWVNPGWTNRFCQLRFYRFNPVLTAISTYSRHPESPQSHFHHRPANHQPAALPCRSTEFASLSSYPSIPIMPFASGSTIKSIRHRSIPLVAAAVLSGSIYGAHTYYTPLLADDSTLGGTKISRGLVTFENNPYTPLGWGSNRHLTLGADPHIGVLKRPTPLTQLGSTPLRDLVIAEKYGACVDARGDCWMWGAGYDASGEIGRSLKGKVRDGLVPSD